jgi:hypothetical protein
MNAISDTKLLIVYNEDSGLFNALSSSLHKALSPETYECQLCRITYGMIHMVGAWKAYSLNLKQLTLPVILLEQDGDIETLLTADEINSNGDITSLST